MLKDWLAAQQGKEHAPTEALERLLEIVATATPEAMTGLISELAANPHDQNERTQAPSKPLYWWGSPQGCPLSPGVTAPGHTP
jgi:hypothetical protein